VGYGDVGVGCFGVLEYVSLGVRFGIGGGEG